MVRPSLGWAMGCERNIWATTAIGLAAGAMCVFAPALAALSLAAAVGFLHLHDAAPTRAHLRSLLILGAIVIAGLIGGPSWAVGAALIWRVSAACAAQAGASRLHVMAAPIAVVMWRLDVPDAVTFALACLALVAWIDWAVARLAHWRLDAPLEAAQVMTAQAAVLAPLLLLPDPAAALAALIAADIARAAKAIVPAYAAA